MWKEDLKQIEIKAKELQNDIEEYIGNKDINKYIPIKIFLVFKNTDNQIIAQLDMKGNWKCKNKTELINIMQSVISERQNVKMKI